MEMDYINTSHPNFVGGSKAVEIAQQQIKASRLATSISRPKDGVNGDKLQASEKSKKSCAILTRAGANGVVHDQALGMQPVSNYDRLGSTGSSSGSAPSWGILSIFGASENQCQGKDNTFKKSSTVLSHNVEHSLSMIQEPPLILKPSESQSKQEALDISITKLLLKSYYDIVRKIIEDTVPKAIMHFLVDHTKRELHNIFIKKLYRESLFDDLLQEADDIVAKRESIRETLKILQQAYKTLDDLSLESEDIVENGYSLDSDSTGLPKVEGVPSSFYSSSNDYSSPKNQIPRKPTPSPEQLSFLYPALMPMELGLIPQ